MKYGQISLLALSLALVGCASKQIEPGGSASQTEVPPPPD